MNTMINHHEIALEAVMRGKEIYRAAFDLSSSAQAIISPDLDILRANAEFCRITGYSEDELAGLTVRDILDPKDRAAAVPRMIGGASTTITFIHKNSTIRRGRSRYHLVEDGHGLPFCMIMEVEDITDPAIPVEAAQMYDRLYRHVIDESTDSIAFLDRNGQVLFMNGAGLAGLGASRGPSAVRCHYADLWNGIHSLAVRAAVKIAASGSTGRLETCTAESGTQRWWDIRIVPIESGGAAITMLVAISREITTLRREEELRRKMEKQLAAEAAPTLIEAPQPQ